MGERAPGTHPPTPVARDPHCRAPPPPLPPSPACLHRPPGAGRPPVALLGGREARARGGRGAVRVWARVSRSRCIVAGRRHRGGGRRWERGGAPCLRRGWGGGGRAPHSCTRTLPPPIHRPAPRSPPLHAPLERRPAAACTDGGPGRLAQAACIADCAGSDRRGLHQGHAHADRVAGHAVPAGECGGGAGGGRECVCESVLGGRPRTGPLLARAWSRPVASHPPTHPPTDPPINPSTPPPPRPPAPQGAADPHPRVRWAACQALGQLCTDLGPDLQEEQHARVMPALLALMDDFSSPRVQAHACAALVNFAGGSSAGCAWGGAGCAAATGACVCEQPYRNPTHWPQHSRTHTHALTPTRTYATPPTDLNSHTRTHTQSLLIRTC